VNIRTAFLALAAFLAPVTAFADELDRAFDTEIGLPAAVPTDSTTTATPAPRRDPSTVGTTLPGRRTPDYLRFADADEGHRTLVETPASNRHSRRHGRHHGNFASR
jgi:hypothetical protein